MSAIVAAAVLLTLTGSACTPAGPVVTGMLPAPGPAGVVPVDQELRLAFDLAMDEVSLTAAVSISPGPPGGLTSRMEPDGKALVLSAGQPWLPETTYEVIVTRAAVDHSGRQLRREFQGSFTTQAPRQVACYSPSFSPAGGRLAWLEDNGSAWQAWLAEPDGSNPRLAHKNLWPHSQLAWLNEDTLLVALGPEDATSRPRAAILPLDGGAPVELPLNERLDQPGQITFGISPDGAYVAVQNDMYMADAHSDFQRQLGVARSDGTNFLAFGNLLLSWGRDSSYLLWLDLPGIGEAHNFDYTLYRYDLASGTSAAVPSAPRINNLGQASRSPDGSTVAFGTWLAEEISTPDGLEIQRLPRDIWLIGTDGRGLRQLTVDQGRNADSHWLGSDSLLLTSDRSGQGWDVWLMPDILDPSSQVNLTARPGYDGEPHSSRADGMIAFVSDASGTREIWLMGAGGSDRRLVSVR